MTEIKDAPDAVALADELAALVGGDVLSDDIHRILYASDASPYQIRPVLILLPRTRADVQAAARWAAGRGLPLTPRGAGSGLAGECLTPGLVIDFTRHMNGLVEVDAGRSAAVVEAGCVFQTLNDDLAGCGKQFGPDPSSGNRATIGGMIGNNATGAHSMRYGHTGEHVNWLEAVLADGSLVRFGADGTAEPADGNAPSPLLEEIRREIPRLLREWSDRIDAGWPTVDRNRAGYALKGTLSGETVNWVRLLAGSEGTLAVTTGAELDLVDTPAVTWMVQANFADKPSMSDALTAVVACGVATCELMDGTLLRWARDAFPEQAHLLPDVEATLLIGIEEADEATAQAVVDRVLAALDQAGGLDGEPAILKDRRDQQSVMAIRKKAVPLLYRGRGGPQAVPVIEDVAVGAAGMPMYIRSLQELGDELGVRLVFYAHAGHGEPHVRPFVDLHTQVGRETFQKLARRAYELAWSVGGTISGEHGCGRVRSGFLRDQYGELYDLMRQVKDVFDPQGVLNPGNIITDLPGEELMVQDLRYDHENLRALAADTVLHWDADELIHEMEACNGCAVCRSLVRTQTMCPVFRAKLTEAAAPRAKANLMRAVITGTLDETYRRREAFREIADNCINCKACLWDCPSRVNVPKLMNEVKARYAGEVGLKRVERVLAGGEGMSRLGSKFGALANVTMALPPTRWLMEKLTGVDRRRPMPAFAWGNGQKKLRKYLRRIGPVDRPIDRVVYFVDMVACYNDHALGRAVVDLLRHNGIELVVPPQKSAAMPPIDYGDIEAARPTIRYNLEQLLPYVREGYRVVSSEPTAALCLQEEWLDIEHTDDAKELSAATVELMAYLWELHTDGKLKTDFAPVPVKLDYHGPCHMNLVGPGMPGVKLVRLIPGVDVNVINRGCCGIAGTFGFQKRNFDVSLRAGGGMIEALRASDAPFGLTECGTCRMQMEFTSGKPTLHPAKLLALAYGYDVANLPRAVTRGEGGI